MFVFATRADAYDHALAERLSGSILLQVESRGEAWYVSAKDQKRYYIKDGASAYSAMRLFGTGITNADLAKIPKAANIGEIKASPSACSVNALANRLRGKILLQIQHHGEAWYVDPVKCRAIYLKDGAAAYQMMRFLGLGIRTSDLLKIQEGGALAKNNSSAVVPPPAPAVVPSAAPQNNTVGIGQTNRALDVLVVVDISTYLENGRRWNGYGYLTDEAINKGIDDVRLTLAQKANVKMRLQKIIRVSFGTDITPDEGNLKMLNWTSSYLRSPDPPEAFVIISKMGVSWSFGGYSQWVAAPSNAPLYCNEFEFWMQGGESQRHATLAVIDWDHLVGGCGYDFEKFPGTERVSDKPTAGECRNNPNDICKVSSDGSKYLCQGLVGKFPNIDPNVWHESTIVHELLHAVDVNGLGNKAHAGGTQETYNMAPGLIGEFSSRLKGCPAN